MTTMSKGIRPGEPDQTGDLPADPTPPKAQTTSSPSTGERSREEVKKAQHKTDEQLDEALDETFPASDPPAHATPVRPGPHRPAGR
ncbi:MAG TPA: hypothetical protein VJM11_07375 [Nevskiaceae bacterium]|nr:hypothetical protein [Nevskiaceae bacterium]